MSHPDPTRTYAEDILSQWSEDELERLWEMYAEQCKQAHVKADMSQFLVFLEERL